MALIFSSGTVFAQESAKAPVLVEIYSTSTCKYDPSLQERVLQKIGTDKDIVVVNCPKSFKNKGQQADRYARNFCDQRSIGYFRKLMLFTVNTPMVIVNGILEANNNDIDAAINAARSLTNVQKLDVSVEGDALNVHIPKIDSKAKKGTILLYAYLPTENAQTIIEVDPDVDFDDKMQADIALGKSVPFVTEKRLAPLKLRPTVGLVHAAGWAGEEMSFSYPVKELDPFSKSGSEVSFIAVLHEGDEFGPVLAIGEWKAISDVDHPNPAQVSAAPSFASYPPMPKL